MNPEKEIGFVSRSKPLFLAGAGRLFRELE